MQARNAAMARRRCRIADRPHERWAAMRTTQRRASTPTSKNLTACQSRLRGFILASLGNYADTADVLQRTNLILWKKAERIPSGGRVSSLGVNNCAVRSPVVPARQSTRSPCLLQRRGELDARRRDRLKPTIPTIGISRCESVSRRCRVAAATCCGSGTGRRSRSDKLPPTRIAAKMP